MYSTILSPASAKADSVIGEDTGLRTDTLDPVLCCPIAAVASKAATLAVGAATDAAQSDSGSGTNTECPDSALDFATSALYLPPSRLSAVGTRVSGNASVDELIHAVREDRVTI